VPITRAIVCACALAAVLLPGLAGATDIFTLRDALGVAYETNPQLDSQRASLRATDENVAQANAGWRPTINAQGTYGVDNNQAQILPSLTHPLTGQIVVSQPLYRGGRTVAEVGRAKAQVRAGRAQLTNTEENVLLDAVTAYMDVVRDAKSLKLKQNNVADLQKQLDATEEQRKVGELTLTDVAQARARLSGAQADLVNAQGQLQVSRSSFEHAVGRPAETLEQRPPMPAMPASLDDAIQTALKTSPFLLQAQENAKAADYAVDDAASAMQPQVAVQGEYQYAQDQPSGIPTSKGLGGTQTARVTAVVGQVTVPLYQGGADEAQLRQSKEQRAQARLAIADAERQVVDATRSAWESYKAALLSIASQKTEVAADQTALDGVRQEQQVGTRTVLDVLNAEQELLNAEVAEVDAERNATVAAFQLLSAMGKLTAQSLSLRVRYYDPQKHYDDDANRWFGFGN
jgi:outer membrane protein